jgi:hypothetical protein
MSRRTIAPRVLKSAAAAALAYKTPVDTTLLGLYRPVRATTFGIYEYLALVAKLVEIGLCPDAIVMSEDFAVACLEPIAIGGINPLHGVASLACYSFPIFETTLSVTLSTVRKKK